MNSNNLCPIKEAIIQSSLVDFRCCDCYLNECKYPKYKDNNNDESCSFCKDLVSGSGFYISKKSKASVIYKKYLMSFCPKCGRKLPMNILSYAKVLPLPNDKVYAVM
jgi:hypothetical protein